MTRGRERNSTRQDPPGGGPDSDPARGLPAPIVVPCRGDVGELLSREWLLANKIGAYSSSTVIGANTRRYHGLLVAAARPPVARIVALSSLMDELVLCDETGAEKTFQLTTFEFVGTLAPDCRASLVEFRNDLAATFIYDCDGVRVIKEIILAETANAVAVRYRLADGKSGAAPSGSRTGLSARLRIWPFVALRDHHGLRQARSPKQLTYLHFDNDIRVEEQASDAHASNPGALASHAVHITVSAGGGDRSSARGRHGRFHDQPQWWYRFRYRADMARGQEGLEDLFTPGWFEAELTGEAPVQLTASLDERTAALAESGPAAATPTQVPFDATVEQKRQRLARTCQALGDDVDETTRRLALAGDAFVVSRERPAAHPGTTILAGYHWFADWGRDAMISLPGLLLETGRHDAALEVLRTFAEAIDQGMIPNRFDDYARSPHYNSIDASLWFIIAADRYTAATGDEAAWRNHLAGPVDSILGAYHDGTRHDIRADADGLLAGGSEQTQLTWMDVKLAGKPVTPRHGKSVETNALWHAALRIAQRRSDDHRRADSYAELADRAARAFVAAFWNDRTGCLYDCLTDKDQKDASVRPNQILSVALPDCPLSPAQQRSVVAVVRDELLTPCGLRTLSPNDSRYRGRYGISLESRDRAYHQGTVWAWLMGPFVEAHLKVNDFSAPARAQASHWLDAFDEHLAQAGIGFISEIFNGDPPHQPAGCIAQAWSVGEVLRAKRLLEPQRESPSSR